jgi:hypothetical protein
MKNCFAILLTALCIQLSAAHAQVLPTRSQYIEGTLSHLKTKCAEMPALIKDFERQGKPFQAEALRARSQSSDQQDQEREVNELQAGVELSLAVLP